MRGFSSTMSTPKALLKVDVIEMFSAHWIKRGYDVSIGPNLELFNHARTAGDKNAAPNQYAVVAPIPHCTYWKMGPDTVVGERSLGDTSFDVDGTIFAWFDRWLTADTNAWSASTPHVRYFNMGENRWNASDSWPPKEVKSVRMYPRSEGAANSLYGSRGTAYGWRSPHPTFQSLCAT
jgi:predicted acyl esterase